MSNKNEGITPILSNPNGIYSTAELFQNLEASTGQEEGIVEILGKGIIGGSFLGGVLGRGLGHKVGLRGGLPTAIDLLKNLFEDPYQNPKYIEEWLQNDRSSTSLVFVHGFNAKKSAKDDWSKGLVRFANESHLSLYALRWGCDFDLTTFDLTHELFRFIAHFKEMRNLADQEAHNLHHDLSEIPGKLILVGHSLGARLIMRALKSGKPKLKNRLAGVIALAPAVCESDVLIRSPWKRSLVCYSRSDDILKHLYRNVEFERAIGYEGPKSSNFESLDLSDLALGHSDYARHVYDILRRPETVNYLKSRQ